MMYAYLYKQLFFVRYLPLLLTATKELFVRCQTAYIHTCTLTVEMFHADHTLNPVSLWRMEKLKNACVHLPAHALTVEHWTCSNGCSRSCWLSLPESFILLEDKYTVYIYIKAILCKFLNCRQNRKQVDNVIHWKVKGVSFPSQIK